MADADAADDLLYAGDLLDGKGDLIQSGYAFSQVKSYSRKAISGKRLRTKEWDHYCFGDDEKMIALTVADNSYMSIASVSVLDFALYRYISKSKIGFMPKGKLGMPSTCSAGNVECGIGGAKIEFAIDGDGRRTLKCFYPKYDKKLDFSCEIVLDPPGGDNITVAVPFGKHKQFCYNTKLNCLCGYGWYRIGDDRYEFKHGACGCLDWGRGALPHKISWYRSSMSTVADGKPLGLNLGYGFGKPTVSENAVFYDGKAHRLGNVKFDIPFTQGAVDYLKPWTITDENGRLELIFYPMIDRAERNRLLWFSTDRHQVFGKFYGKATLDDGTIVVVSDTIGFAEYVKNRW